MLFAKLMNVSNQIIRNTTRPHDTHASCQPHLPSARYSAVPTSLTPCILCRWKILIYVAASRSSVVFLPGRCAYMCFKDQITPVLGPTTDDKGPRCPVTGSTASRNRSTRMWVVQRPRDSVCTTEMFLLEKPEHYPIAVDLTYYM